MVLSVIGSLLSHSQPVPAAQRVPVILDTDIGGDVDDVWALAMLLMRPEVDVRLVVTARDNTPAKTRLVAKILTRLGRTDVPIGTGIRTSDGYELAGQRLGTFQDRWVGDFELTEYPGQVYEDGVAAMIDSIHQSVNPVTILAIGPQTNLAAALARDPSIVQNAHVVAMAGSIHIGDGGKPGRCAECNVVTDVEAIRAVLKAPWEITWTPVDVCGTLALDEEQYGVIQRSESPAAKLVVENYAQWALRDKFPEIGRPISPRGTPCESGTSILYDTLAVYLTFDESLCRFQTISVSIDSSGFSVPDEAGQPVRCAIDWTDRQAFEQLLVETLTAGNPNELEGK